MFNAIFNDNGAEYIEFVFQQANPDVKLAEIFNDKEYQNMTMKLRVMYMQGKTKNSKITEQLQ